jgi:hypothetical protein
VRLDLGLGSVTYGRSDGSLKGELTLAPPDSAEETPSLREHQACGCGYRHSYCFLLPTSRR